MKRRTKALLGVSVLVAALAAASIIAYPAWQTSRMRSRLAGDWEGTGTVTGQIGMNLEGKPTINPVTATSTVLAHFSSDGTYTWNDHLKSDRLDMTAQVPRGAGATAPWQVVGVWGEKLRLQLHFGQVDFDFTNPDTFTMNHAGTGVVTFHRAGTR